MDGNIEEMATWLASSKRFSYGEGWGQLVQSMFREVLERLNNPGIDTDVVSVSGKDFEVKEKRGRLSCHSVRFDCLDDIFERYEHQSQRVCEVCGSVGRLSGDGEWWLSTRCREHRIF
jgi:hypothetical protein